MFDVAAKSRLCKQTSERRRRFLRGSLNLPKLGNAVVVETFIAHLVLIGVGARGLLRNLLHHPHS